MIKKRLNFQVSPKIMLSTTEVYLWVRLPNRTARISLLFWKSDDKKTLIICRYLLNLIVLLIFGNTNVVTFPKTENLKVSLTGKFTGSW